MVDNSLIFDLSQEVKLDLVLISAGDFWMGSDLWSYKERPKHAVSLPDYWIGKYTVTVEQYAAFIHASGYPTRPLQIDDPAYQLDFPVVQVNWYDGQAFCRWVEDTILANMSQFKGCQARLPSEAEWEKAARGTDGQEYPWGSQEPDVSRCNFDRSLGQLTRVGHFSPKGDCPYGCADMAGNVWEWTHSLYRPYPYRAEDGREQEDVEEERVVRGGAVYNMAGFMRCSYRATNDPLRAFTSRGFRLCVSPIHL